MMSPLVALLKLHEMNMEPAEDAQLARRQEQLLMQALPDRLQAHYQTAKRRYGLTAVVPLERGVCRGCFVRQPANRHQVEDGIYNCQHCSRVLYDPDAAYEELVG